ncbi:MAG: hypothetical protein AB7I50_11165 [Vicinamibacterales bacterium]
MSRNVMLGLGGVGAAVLGSLLYVGVPVSSPGTEGAAGAAQSVQDASSRQAPATRAASETPGRPAERPAVKAETAAIQIEIDGIDGVLPAVGLVEAFSIDDASGRRLPQATASVTRVPDDYTGSLLGTHASGRVIRAVTIKQIGSGGSTLLTLRLERVVIEAVHVETQDGVSSEVVTFRFGRVRRTDPGGVDFGWDYSTMRGL